MKHIYIILIFSFFCSLTNVSYSQNEKGVVINGVTWATCNVGASIPEEYGEYFTWEEAKMACPEGWRLPTLDELKSLKNTGSEWTTQNDKNGRLFGNAPNQIFLPAAGYGYGLRGIINAGAISAYWSSTMETDVCNLRNAFILDIALSNAYAVVYSVYKTDYGSVRCVKK